MQVSVRTYCSIPYTGACSFHDNSMNNLLSYCGLIDAKIRSSDKDLPVQVYNGVFMILFFLFIFKKN